MAQYTYPILIDSRYMHSTYMMDRCGFRKVVQSRIKAPQAELFEDFRQDVISEEYRLRVHEAESIKMAMPSVVA